VPFQKVSVALPAGICELRGGRGLLADTLRISDYLDRRKEVQMAKTQSKSSTDVTRKDARSASASLVTAFPSGGRIVRKPQPVSVLKGAMEELRRQAPVKLKPKDIEAIHQAALTRRAQERLRHIDEMRDAFKLLADGCTQREVAEILDTTQPRVHRMLRALEARGTIERTPEEIILRARVGELGREELVEDLRRLTYTFAKVAPKGSDGVISGTWDQVRQAARSGLLTKDEFERVRDEVKPPKA
jgi:DNA-binding MarR family transcriptional regulator